MKWPEVALALELRKPLLLDTIAKRCDKSLEETKKQMDLLTEDRRGHLPFGKRRDGLNCRCLCPASWKMMNNRAQCENTRKFRRALKSTPGFGAGLLSPKLPVGASPMRVIPIQSAIDGGQPQCSL